MSTRIRPGEIVLTLLALAAASVSPNLFVVSQAGYAKLSVLAVDVLFPSLAILGLVLIFAWRMGYDTLRKQIMVGIVGGFLATAGLEVVRETGFRLGGMPGEMPMLLGVNLLDRFMMGPNLWSNIAGWSYHFWNGAAFGIIYCLLFGRRVWWFGILYALLIATVFMASPAVVALGVGRFGVDFGIGFPVTVYAAHIVFGSILGYYISRKGLGFTNLINRFGLCHGCGVGSI